jgi:hypothetical protein
VVGQPNVFVQPGDYTVEAVVTNVNPVPFAATVPVTIATPSAPAGIALP